MHARDTDVLCQVDFFMAMEAMDRRTRCPTCPFSIDRHILPISGFKTVSGDQHIKFFCSSCSILHERASLRQDKRSVPPLIAKILSYRKVRICTPADRKTLLAFPVTSADVAAIIRGMPSRRAAGPDGLTYEMLKTLVEIPSLLEVIPEGISLLFTPDGLSYPRVTASLKSAITNFLAKPDKSDEKLNLIHNLRPITLRVVISRS